ncbi:hypothetical protein V6N12_035821 [Hibiscus sabdariffa]|uniref:RRM domain-containing protein n=1 Tax=Hibiscus sabdariffa TaxID=183260 RepID=A0ABR2ENV9_9ROSI
MALASRFRRVFTGPSTICSQFSSLRLNSTLTSPKLFISGLSRETTDEQFKEAFNQFGQIVEEAEKAREEMNAKFLHGWAIFVDSAKPRKPRGI